MAVPHPLPPELAGLIAERFRALAEPMRVRILDALRGGDAAVGELAERLGTSQQNVSRHVSVLVGAGIVGREKVGTSVRLHIADPAVFDLCEAVCGGLGRELERLRSILETTEVTP
ncbi:MAG: ArsR/SmtB family transcription factor [Thermoleophilia bacterium]